MRKRSLSLFERIYKLLHRSYVYPEIAAKKHAVCFHAHRQADFFKNSARMDLLFGHGIRIYHRCLFFRSGLKRAGCLGKITDIQKTAFICYDIGCFIRYRAYKLSYIFSLRIYGFVIG